MLRAYCRVGAAASGSHPQSMARVLPCVYDAHVHVRCVVTATSPALAKHKGANHSESVPRRYKKPKRQQPKRADPLHYHMKKEHLYAVRNERMARRVATGRRAPAVRKEGIVSGDATAEETFPKFIKKITEDKQFIRRADYVSFWENIDAESEESVDHILLGLELTKTAAEHKHELSYGYAAALKTCIDAGVPELALEMAMGKKTYAMFPEQADLLTLINVFTSEEDRDMDLSAEAMNLLSHDQYSRVDPNTLTALYLDGFRSAMAESDEGFTRAMDSAVAQYFSWVHYARSVPFDFAADTAAATAAQPGAGYQKLERVPHKFTAPLSLATLDSMLSFATKETKHVRLAEYFVQVAKQNSNVIRIANIAPEALATVTQSIQEHNCVVVPPQQLLLPLDHADQSAALDPFADTETNTPTTVYAAYAHVYDHDALTKAMDGYEGATVEPFQSPIIATYEAEVAALKAEVEGAESDAEE